MPTVFTLSGSGDRHEGERCKTVRRKDGCTIQLCPKKHKGKRVMHFKKGTMRCPHRGR